jgi:hypothetical protein
MQARSTITAKTPRVLGRAEAVVDRATSAESKRRLKRYFD